MAMWLESPLLAGGLASSMGMRDTWGKPSEDTGVVLHHAATTQKSEVQAAFFPIVLDEDAAKRLGVAFFDLVPPRHFQWQVPSFCRSWRRVTQARVTPHPCSFVTCTIT